MVIFYDTECRGNCMRKKYKEIVLFPVKKILGYVASGKVLSIEKNLTISFITYVDQEMTSNSNKKHLLAGTRILKK